MRCAEDGAASGLSGAVETEAPRHPSGEMQFGLGWQITVPDLRQPSHRPGSLSLTPSLWLAGCWPILSPNLRPMPGDPATACWGADVVT